MFETGFVPVFYHQEVEAACDAHGKHLILRTFCYDPKDLERVRDGVKMIGDDLTVMITCVPHDWQTFYPHDPLIEYLKDIDKVIEFDLGHEPFGAGRTERFRNHAVGTMNWAGVYAFSRLAQATEISTLGKEWASYHTNMNSGASYEQNQRWNRSVWMPDDCEVAILSNPTPDISLKPKPSKTRHLPTTSS